MYSRYYTDMLLLYTDPSSTNSVSVSNPDLLKRDTFALPLLLLYTGYSLHLPLRLLLGLHALVSSAIYPTGPYNIFPSIQKPI